MKVLILAITLTTGSALAEVIECPATHQGARLVGAGMYEGEQKEAELAGVRKRTQVGVDVEYGFNRGDVKWVACWYEPATPRWYRVSPAAIWCGLRERTERPGQVTAVVRCK